MDQSITRGGASMDLQHLLRLERGFWLEGADYYREHLAEDFLMLFPGLGTISRAEAIRGLDAGPRWSELETAEERVLHLGPDARLLCYEARARRDGGERYSALAGSVYVHREGAWSLVYHQQSPTG
jgi:hypothetical protein